MLRPPYNARLLCHAATVVAIAWPAAATRAQDTFWDAEPYRIEALIALDVPGGLNEQLAQSLPAYLQDRASASFGLGGDLKARVVTGAERRRAMTLASSRADGSRDLLPEDRDKLLLIAVRKIDDGYELAAREYDRYVDRWGMPITHRCVQQSALSEQVFRLMRQAVAPLARIELDPSDSTRVWLQPRGEAWQGNSVDSPPLRVGDVLLPLLRRTSRSGKLVEGSIQVVPWTYIEVIEVDGNKIVGRIHSGSRRPFGIRRRGRIDQVGIALRADPGEAIVKLHSRTNKDKPLVGYEVYARNVDEEATRPIGSSGRDGRIAIPPGRTGVQQVFIKNGGELLARLPIVPGAVAELEVPLPDDDARLTAEARLAALREELVDVVVRRNILMARTRQRIEAKEWKEAQELMRTLDQLPGRAQFDLALSREARLLRSDDPQIQRRIDRLVEATQNVVGQFLDSRQINQLHDELIAAQRDGESS